MDLLEVVESTQLCADCLTIRTTRSRHCSVCNRCVERFDHHCPWINNCVGVKNHRQFLLFVISMFSTVTIAFVQGFQCLVLVTRIGFQEATQKSYSFMNVNSSIYTFYLFISIQIFVSGLFFIPLLWLSIV